MISCDLVFDTESLVHELGHSITREDGNSIEEEIQMEVLADKVTSEAGLENEKESYESIKGRVEEGYKSQNLADDNGVKDTLEAEGIDLDS